MYAMGDCADDILATLSIGEETPSYHGVKTATNEPFGARKNVVVERATFDKKSTKVRNN